ncbi:MAG: MBL fold metallo-hydrolase [Clostridia bacterium]
MIRFQSFLSGSSGNCTFITDGTVHLLIDCGAGGKYITECMRRIGVAPDALSGILITHEHRDHIAGAGIMSRKFNIPIYATPKTWEAIRDSLGTLAPGNRRLTEPVMRIGGLSVRSFPIPHDAAQPVGYSFTSGSERFTVATDLGCVTDDLLETLMGSTSVIIEANHDVDMLKKGRYPYPLKKRILGDRGHLSNENCGRLCARLAKNGTCAFWLGHLSAENNNPLLAYDTVAASLQEESLTVGAGVALNVLPRYWIG